ncbi:MAG: type II toxin-antitoxin system Phd/YefM family antitoxin [Lachnospiraceae bacterium]|nr:type II toxin-antitoxin system Phd/YefM family antitoxin [Lachnospiraceae bacterium]
MTQISVSELKTNPGKYVMMAQEQDVLITKNGKVAAKLVSAKPDKKAALERLYNIYPKGLHVDLDKEREERFK